jgi:hypothetical protein
MNRYYVYVYVDPTNSEPIYVGKGHGDRARCHLVRTDNHPLTRRLAWLKRRGLEPLIKLIDVETEELAYELEDQLIELVGRADLKTGPLLNLAAGGRGLRNPGPEARLAMAAKFKRVNTGVPKTASWKESMRASIQKRRTEQAATFSLALQDPVKRTGLLDIPATAAKHSLPHKEFDCWIRKCIAPTLPATQAAFITLASQPQRVSPRGTWAPVSA